MKNEGGIDRVIRLVAGVGLAVAAFLAFGLMDGAVLGIVSAVVAVVLVGTAVVGFCPAYHLVGIRTCKLNTPTDAV